ncbi:sensor histidine kinase [Mucilaginibacter sp. McL0603]|uniref:sensor histidine kinase n=1 Tax=Mucilaginibacter sp. McL0603 TaxID=3415670 RepID=UPI003CECF8FE
MFVFYFLAAFLLVNRLKKSLRFSLLYPKWRSLITVATWSVIALCILTFSLDDGFQHLVGAAILFGLLFYINREPDFQSQRPYLIANVPLIVMGLINSIALFVVSDFYEKYDNYFSWATVVAFAWIFGKWATSKKQEEELRISTERRAELEILVQERTTELSKQKEELQEIVKELKSTQNQLIQSEKMASLGELTAGIAHEIQNPLNFVNNFSEVSMELVDEMEEELNKGDKAEAIAIATDIKQNLEKIRHHGQRADGIVKGMLQHSRASSGQKEPTDINVLADEYLRLAYHGLRAKDKSFNADLVTHFDTAIPKANMVPQDVGRVLLNLFTNAFYAVQQKHKKLGAEFKPAVEVTTSTEKKFITVKVKDNGTGIPESIKDKIMQPFFTTKPTGEGTGLGLSMSYDIVVKAHGGSIDINTKEGEYTEFVVKIPA